MNLKKASSDGWISTLHLFVQYCPEFYLLHVSDCCHTCTCSYFLTVRDATARLPNGEGTRTDICELLKDSQYLAPVSQESTLHSVVSGALDRLHYETDPCVKYDTKRKIWIYLHRGRTEEEFGECELT